MPKKYWVVGSLVGLLMIGGAGCASDTKNTGQRPAETKGNATQPTANKLINPKGDINAALSANDKQEIIADVKNIATSIFGNGVKMQGLMGADIIAKGSMGIGYSTPEPIEANQLDAMINAFKAAGYSIIESHRPTATDEDKSGGVIAEKRSKVLILNFEPGQKEIGFSAMSKDQYTYLMNTDEKGNPI